MVKTEHGMEDLGGRTQQGPQKPELQDQGHQLGPAKEADLGAEAAEQQDQDCGRTWGGW